MHSSRSSARRRRATVRVSTLCVASLLLVGLPAAAASAAPKSPPGTGAAAPGQEVFRDSAKSAAGCQNGNANTYDKLLDCMTAAGVMEHLEAFQAIADASGGNRAAGLPGYDASVDYVVAVLEAAGWQVELDDFVFDFFREIAPETLTVPGLTIDPGDTVTMQFSGSGTVTGPLEAVDVEIPPAGAAGTTDSGCEPEDFADFEAGSIAVIQRGYCNFSVKVQNALDAGAVGVIIFNEGQEGRTDPFVGTLGGPFDIPVVFASYELGAQLVAAEGAVASLTTSTESEERVSQNVIATLPGRTSDNIVMAGAHLDSVQEGPGINDNGSGTAVLLETAQLLGKANLENTVRLAFWGAEELGLIGSWDWVETHPEEIARTAVYLNFDMVGSPNHIFMVYDSDQSTYPAPEGVPIPEGSIEVEDVFESFYTLMGIPYEDTEFSGRSDYEAFIFNGVPSSGLFTGAEGVKTPEQAAIWGGTAGEWYDPCYHQECDDIDNLNMEALEVNADAVAFAIMTLAYSTETVNDVPGKKVPGKPFTMPAPAGPEGTAGGSGGLHDHADAA